MRIFVILGWIGAALLLAACAQTDSNHLSSTYLNRFATPNPTLAEFPVCHGFGCTVVSRASLSKADWHRIVAIFRPPATDAQIERQHIARAVALIQVLIGEQTGTAGHQWTHQDLQILPNKGDKTQLDCIDEAINTWTYMTLMEKAGLLRFHRVAQLAHAGTLLDIRNAAVLQENDGDYFVIDPSLVDAGVAPPIMPLTTWADHWPPDLSPNNTHS